MTPTGYIITAIIVSIILAIFYGWVIYKLNS